MKEYYLWMRKLKLGDVNLPRVGDSAVIQTRPGLYNLCS